MFLFLPNSSASLFFFFYLWYGSSMCHSLIRWPYFLGIMLGPVVQFPLFLELGAPCGLCSPFYYIWVLTAVGTPMGGYDSQTDLLWGSVVTTAEYLLWRVQPHGAKLISGGLWFLLSLSLECVSLRRGLYGAPAWSEAGYWFWWLYSLLKVHQS